MTNGNKQSNWEEPDPILALLVGAMNSVNEPVAGQSITVITKGGVVSGLLIPNWQWFEELGANEGADDALFSDWAKQFKIDRDARKSAWSKDESELTDDEVELRGQATHFIHLKNAQILLPSPSPDILWRGKLSEICGWNLGKMQATIADN